jgi:hypothetical protein
MLNDAKVPSDLGKYFVAISFLAYKYFPLQKQLIATIVE